MNKSNEFKTRALAEAHVVANKIVGMVVVADYRLALGSPVYLIVTPDEAEAISKASTQVFLSANPLCGIDPDWY